MTKYQLSHNDNVMAVRSEFFFRFSDSGRYCVYVSMHIRDLIYQNVCVELLDIEEGGGVWACSPHVAGCGHHAAECRCT